MSVHLSEPDFIAALEQELQRAGVTFRPADVRAFVARSWALIRAQPDVTFWAREFIDQHPGGAGMMA
jgi:hypothetical protein